MAIYHLRYFFDAGSGVCLWSENPAAREEFGYPIEISQLKLNENLIRRAYYLIAWYDTCIDWDYPPNPSPWSEEEKINFNRVALELYEELCKNLGAEFLIKNEFLKCYGSQ